MKREKVIWTDQQTAKLEKQILAGKPLARIKIGGKTKKHIANRINYLQKHGSKLRLTKTPWTDRENQELVKQVEEMGLPPRKVSVKDFLGRKRSPLALGEQISVLRNRGLITKIFVDRAPAQKPTGPELELILSKTAGSQPGFKLGPAGLAKLPRLCHRSKSSIAGIIHSRGLTNPVLSKKASKAFKNRLSPKRRKEILVYLRTEGRYLPDALAASECKVDRSVITRLRKKCNLPRYSHEECMKDPVYRQWYEAQVEQRAKTLKEKIRTAYEERRKFLEQQKRLLAPKRLPMHFCSLCGKDYPKTDVFFRQYKGKWRGGGPKHILSSLCTACPVKKEKKTEVRSDRRNKQLQI
jgi:hypothetical protein